MKRMPTICFDEEAKIRILPPEQFQQTQELDNECKTFLSKTNEFRSMVDAVAIEMSKVAANIEREKLKAIGQRNQLENEDEDCERKIVCLANLLKEKQIEFDRYQAQYESLLRAEANQMTTIDKLQHS